MLMCLSTSRVDALLHELHTNPDVLLSDPDPSKEAAFTSWQKDFSADQSTDEIAALLDRYPELRSKMDNLVPERVSYKDFWMRYLYQKSKIDADEARRKQLFQNHVDDNDFDWDGDDEVDETQQTDDFYSINSHEGKISSETVKPKSSSTQPSECAPRNSSTSESSTSFDIVSLSSAIPPITKDKVCLIPLMNC
jgi:hypothetical protein